MPKKILLSRNRTRIERKDQGNYHTGFNIEQFDLDNKDDVDSLSELFQSNVYSMNTWGDPKPKDKDKGYHGSCKKENYSGMHGIILDIDEPGLTLEEAKEKFKDFVYIIHTSSGHQVDKPEKGGIIDRYRVILPFEPRYNDEPWFVKPNDADQFYEFLKGKFPYSDPSIFERARKGFPFAGQDRNKYEFYVNAKGKYLSFTLDEIKVGIKERCKLEQINIANEKIQSRRIQKQVIDQNRQLEQSIEWKNKTRTNVSTGAPYFSPTGEEYAMPDEIFKINIEGRWIDVPFQKLKETMRFNDIDKVTAYCNHCDDINSDSASAFVYKDFRGFFVVECSHCRNELEKKSNGQQFDERTTQFRWREYPVSSAMFSQNKRIYEMKVKSSMHIGPHELCRDEWKYNDEADFAHQYIKKERFFLSNNFTINYYSDPELTSDMPDYNLDFKKNEINIAYPIADADGTDNAEIDNYIDDTFGQYSDFVKDWMAMYTFTNYQALPVLVLTGGRGTGKNTFVQMVSDVFPMLWSQWSGDSERFNYYYTKKLLWIDENAFGDKRSQYDEIKYLTGNEYVTVEEKYQPRYRVRNNIKIIMTTNDFKPLAVKNEEAPDSDKDNNFFFYEFKNLDPAKRDRQLGYRLRANIGNYARTSLKQRYQSIVANPDNSCRYSIPCPITSYADEVYKMARTELDIALDEIKEHLTTFRKTHLKLSELKAIMKDKNFNPSNAKQYLTAMQRKGIIGNEDIRLSSMRMGFKVLCVDSSSEAMPYDDYDIFA